jgi:hypothetical protein
MMKLIVAFRNFANAPKMYINLQVKYSLFLPILVKLEFSLQIFENIEMKFHENPSSGSRFVPRGRTEGQMEKKTDRHGRS